LVKPEKKTKMLARLGHVNETRGGGGRATRNLRASVQKGGGSEGSGVGETVGFPKSPHKRAKPLPKRGSTKDGKTS